MLIGTAAGYRSAISGGKAEDLFGLSLKIARAI
jgi:hypothetical protein